MNIKKIIIIFNIFVFHLSVAQQTDEKEIKSFETYLINKPVSESIRVVKKFTHLRAITKEGLKYSFVKIPSAITFNYDNDPYSIAINIANTLEYDSESGQIMSTGKGANFQFYSHYGSKIEYIEDEEFGKIKTEVYELFFFRKSVTLTIIDHPKYDPVVIDYPNFTLVLANPAPELFEKTKD